MVIVTFNGEYFDFNVFKVRLGLDVYFFVTFCHHVLLDFKVDAKVAALLYFVKSFH